MPLFAAFAALACRVAWRTPRSRLSLSLLASVAPQPVAAQGLPDFTELVEKVGPAVVNIRTTERGRDGAWRLAAPSMDEEMAELFRRFSAFPDSRTGPTRAAAAAARRTASRSSAASARASSSTPTATS